MEKHNTLDTVTLNTGLLASTSSAISIPTKTSIFTIYIRQRSGTLAGTNILVQCSDDSNKNWCFTNDFSSVVAIGVTDYAFTIGPMAADFIRLYVSTASGIASTADITIQAK